MKNTNTLINEALIEIKSKGFAQVPGYKRFSYLRQTNSAVLLMREKGTETRVPFKTLARTFEAVRQDPSVYHDGPNRLREFGITHVTSPTWALLHLLPLESILE